MMNEELERLANFLTLRDFGISIMLICGGAGAVLVGMASISAMYFLGVEEFQRTETLAYSSYAGVAGVLNIVAGVIGSAALVRFFIRGAPGAKWGLIAYVCLCLVLFIRLLNRPIESTFYATATFLPCFLWLIFIWFKKARV